MNTTEKIGTDIALVMKSIKTNNIDLALFFDDCLEVFQSISC